MIHGNNKSGGGVGRLKTTKRTVHILKPIKKNKVGLTWSCTKEIMGATSNLDQSNSKKRDLHMVSINLEKVYDEIPRDQGGIQHFLAKKNVHKRHIDAIKDITSGAIISVRIIGGETSASLIKIVLSQGSVFGTCLFSLVMLRYQDEVPWCMLLTIYLVLIDEIRAGTDYELVLWREALESKGLNKSN